jgi:Secretion system C-terminal sorting domain
VDDWCLSQTMSTAQETEEQDPPSQTLDFIENKKNEQKNAAISRFLIYPNPTDNVLNIRSLDGIEVSTEVTVFNAFGQHVFSRKLEIGAGGDNQLEVGHLPDGIYFLSVPSNSRLAKPTNIRFVVLKN